MSSRKKKGAESHTFLPPLALAPPLPMASDTQRSSHSSRASSFVFSRHSSRHSSFVPSASPSKFPIIPARESFSGEYTRFGGKENFFPDMGESLRLQWKLRGIGDHGDEERESDAPSSVTPQRSGVESPRNDQVLTLKLNRVAQANKPGVFLPRLAVGGGREPQQELKRSRKGEKSKSSEVKAHAHGMDSTVSFPALIGSMTTIRGCASSDFQHNKSHLAELKAKHKTTKGRSAHEDGAGLPELFPSPRRVRRTFSTGEVSPPAAPPAAADDTAATEFSPVSPPAVEKANSDSSGSEVVMKKKHRAH